MEKINDKNVNSFYDLVDKGCMKLYDSLHLNYLEALTKFSHAICYGISDAGLNTLDDDAFNYLSDIIDNLNEVDYTDEEIRLALQLLMIKAFKHIGYSLDLMTPDKIGYIFSYIIKNLLPYPFDIIDTEVGSGNLLNLILNDSDNEVLNKTAIDNDLDLLNLCCETSNLMKGGVRCYYQNALSDCLDVADCIIGDLYSNIEAIENKTVYAPFEIILKRLNNLRDGGIFVYLIDNSFFSYEGGKEFMGKLNSACSDLALFALDSKLFKDPSKAKCILVGIKNESQGVDLYAHQLNLDNELEVKKVIDSWISNIRRLS